MAYAIALILVLLLAYALIKKTQPDEITEIEPKLSVEDIIASSQQEEEKTTLEKIKDIEFGDESEIKKLIVKFVNEKPEAVAQLLRNWLNEDWE